MSLEYRKVEPVEMELQFRSMPDGSTTFEGYAAVYNKPSKVIHDNLARSNRGYRETLAPGVFKRALTSGDRITLVVDHDERKMVSSAPPFGQLRLAEDTYGLHVMSPWPKTTYTETVRALHDSGEKLGMSVYFGTGKNGATYSASGTERMVTEGVLKHTSVLATMEPAYDGTVAGFRALAEMTAAPVEDIDALMDALRDGQRLDDAQYNLLSRLSDAVKPEQAEPPLVLSEKLQAIVAKINNTI